MMSPQVGGQIVDLRSEPSRRVLNGKYRRNGKLQSCEPCRKSKLRCDHVVPTCSRCVKRDCAEKCVYHPNPLTGSSKRQNKGQSGEKSLPTPAATVNEGTPPILRPTIESSESGTPDPAEHRRVIEGSSRDFDEPVPLPAPVPVPAPAQATANSVNRAASAPPLHSHQCDGGPARVNPGFFGATSFMCIFSENLGKLGVVSSELDGPKLARVTVSNDQIVRGARVLSFLKDTNLVHGFVGRSFEIGESVCNVCTEPVMKQWLINLWAIHGETLTGGSTEKLHRLSELIWRNTLTSVVVKEDTNYKEWALQSTGMNIRWEVIGIIAALIGQCAATLGRSDPLLTQHNIAKPFLTRKMSEIAATCLDFCRCCEALDDLFIWLVIENTLLTAAIKGDGSYALYSEMGELVNAVVAMGLHIDVKQGKPRIPFFLEQIRKGIVVMAYASEVSTASYLGRPPRLSYRYCNLPSLLDIPDAQLLGSEEEIARIISKLDENGFNTSGKVSRTTAMKAWLSFAPRREEILDLALGRYTREEILQRAAEIQRKSEEFLATVPAFVRDIKPDTWDYGGVGVGSQKERPAEAFLKIHLNQGFRVNELLLQRVLIRRTGASWDKLVESASSIFQDVLLVSKRHELASILQSDISALLAVQGLRSAAVIAVELLKQEQLPNYPKNPLLPRSRTIQDLSVFAARLGDVDPSDGTFTICDQGRKIITRILDKILSPPPLVPERPSVSHTQHEHQNLAQASEGLDIHLFPGESVPQQEWPVIDPLDFQMGEANWGIEVPFLGNDSDFVQWLESVDWERPI